MPRDRAFSVLGCRRDSFRGSITCGLTILARFACPDVNALAIMQLYFDGLVATVATYVKAHLVTAFFQFADDLIWDSALDFNVATFFHFFAGRFIISLMLPACSVARFLRIQTKIDLIGQDLNVSLWLHPASHHPERFPRFSILHHESRNDGVKRTFAWRVDVGMARLHREKLATILKHEAESRYNDSAAHAAIVTLNERFHITLVVRRAHVNGVAVVDRGAFWRRGRIL